MTEPGTADETADTDLNLAEAMAEAARSINTPLTLEEVLDRLARAACTAIPGVDHAGVSIARRAGIDTMAATDQLVEEVDQLQYQLGEGPCLDAIAGHKLARVHDRRTEQRWPRFAPAPPSSGCCRSWASRSSVTAPPSQG